MPVIVCATGVVMVIVWFAVFTQPPAVITEYEMNEVPAATPVITPVTGSTVALAGVPLLHVPPEVVEVYVVVLPMHKALTPVMACATGALMNMVWLAVFTQLPAEVTL